MVVGGFSGDSDYMVCYVHCVEEGKRVCLIQLTQVLLKRAMKMPCGITESWEKLKTESCPVPLSEKWPSMPAALHGPTPGLPC